MKMTRRCSLEVPCMQTRNMVGGGILPFQVRVQAPSFAGQSTDDQDASYHSSKPDYHQNDISAASATSYKNAVADGRQARYTEIPKIQQEGQSRDERMLKHKPLSHSRTYLPKEVSWDFTILKPVCFTTVGKAVRPRSQGPLLAVEMLLASAPDKYRRLRLILCFGRHCSKQQWRHWRRRFVADNALCSDKHPDMLSR